MTALALFVLAAAGFCLVHELAVFARKPPANRPA